MSREASKHRGAADSNAKRRFGTTAEKYWFLGQGLLGLGFHWDRWQEHLTPGQPSDLRRLYEEVTQMTETDPEFSIKARNIALEALNAEDSDTLCRAIQVLCVTGSDEDLVRLSKLAVTDEKVGKHLKSCLFTRGIRKK